MRWFKSAERRPPACANVCGRPATQTATAGNLVALVCDECAAKALERAPGTKLKKLADYVRTTCP